MMPRGTKRSKILGWARMLVGAAVLTALFFLVLPLIQAINGRDEKIVELMAAPVITPPPTPPPPEDKPEEKEEPEEKPPVLEEPVQPMSLDDLELSLTPGVGGGLGTFPIKLPSMSGSTTQVESMFSLRDLDQEPRVMYQPAPTLSNDLRRKTPAKVHVVFDVDEGGRVRNPKVLKATDPSFERPALAAVKHWKFEPGKRNGQPVGFRMRVPITFPGGRP